MARRNYCNHRYDGDEKCASPSISESDIKKYYLEALEKLLSNKDSYITECQERLENEDVLVQLKETRQQAEISLENLMILKLCNLKMPEAITSSFMWKKISWLCRNSKRCGLESMRNLCMW